MQKIETGKVTWINITKPTAKEVQILREGYGIHPIVGEQLLEPTLRPKVEDYGEYLYLVLHFPLYDAARKTTVGREIDFITTQKTLITVHYEAIPPLEEFFGKCANQVFCQQLFMSKSAGELLYYLLRELYIFSFRQLDHITEKMAAIEEGIFNGREVEMVSRISLVRRDILDFRRTIKPQQLVLESLTERGTSFWGKSIRPYLTDALGEYLRLWNLLENHKETVESLFDTNQSLLGTRTNEIMKILTIVATILLPLSLLSSIFGMSVQIGGRVFWIVLFGMLVLGFGLFQVFKKKKWL